MLPNCRSSFSMFIVCMLIYDFQFILTLDFITNIIYYYFIKWEIFSLKLSRNVTLNINTFNWILNRFPIPIHVPIPSQELRSLVCLCTFLLFSCCYIHAGLILF